MRLNDVEAAMLAGEKGPAVQEVIRQQVEVGRFFGAARFVEVTNVHMMGDIEVMGDFGLRFLRKACEQRAHCVRPLTTNARCMDFAWSEALGQQPSAVRGEREIIVRLQSLGAMTVDTCINYQTAYQPHGSTGR